MIRLLWAQDPTARPSLRNVARRLQVLEPGAQPQPQLSPIVVGHDEVWRRDSASSFPAENADDVAGAAAAAGLTSSPRGGVADSVKASVALTDRGDLGEGGYPDSNTDGERGNRAAVLSTGDTIAADGLGEGAMIQTSSAAGARVFAGDVGVENGARCEDGDGIQTGPGTTDADVLGEGVIIQTSLPVGARVVAGDVGVEDGVRCEDGDGVQTVPGGGDTLLSVIDAAASVPSAVVRSAVDAVSAVDRATAEQGPKPERGPEVGQMTPNNDKSSVADDAGVNACVTGEAGIGTLASQSDSLRAMSAENGRASEDSGRGVFHMEELSSCSSTCSCSRDKSTVEDTESRPWVASGGPMTVARGDASLEANTVSTHNISGTGGGDGSRPPSHRLPSRMPARPLISFSPLASTDTIPSPLVVEIEVTDGRTATRSARVSTMSDELEMLMPELISMSTVESFSEDGTESLDEGDCASFQEDHAYLEANPPAIVVEAPDVRPLPEEARAKYPWSSCGALADGECNGEEHPLLAGSHEVADESNSSGSPGEGFQEGKHRASPRLQPSIDLLSPSLTSRGIPLLSDSSAGKTNVVMTPPQGIPKPTVAASLPLQQMQPQGSLLPPPPAAAAPTPPPPTLASPKAYQLSINSKDRFFNTPEGGANVVITPPQGVHEPTAAAVAATVTEAMSAEMTSSAPVQQKQPPGSSMPPPPTLASPKASHLSIISKDRLFNSSEKGGNVVIKPPPGFHEPATMAAVAAKSTSSAHVQQKQPPGSSILLLPPPPAAASPTPPSPTLSSPKVAQLSSNSKDRLSDSSAGGSNAVMTPPPGGHEPATTVTAAIAAAMASYTPEPGQHKEPLQRSPPPPPAAVAPTRPPPPYVDLPEAYQFSDNSPGGTLVMVTPPPGVHEPAAVAAAVTAAIGATMASSAPVQHNQPLLPAAAAPAPLRQNQREGGIEPASASAKSGPLRTPRRMRRAGVAVLRGVVSSSLARLGGKKGGPSATG